MKTSTLIASVLSMCLVGIAAGADTLRVDFALVNNPNGDPYSPGASVEYEIIGTLATDTDSQGLAFFAYDIQIDGLTKITLETAAENLSTDDSASFERNLGYSDEFGGTADENDLIQAGGGQNTIGNTENDVPPFPVGDVVLNVGFPPDGAVLMTGVLTLPGPGEIEDGTYTMSIIDGSLYANVISLDGGPLGGQPVFPVETAEVLIGNALVFDVVTCDDAIAPELMPAPTDPNQVPFAQHGISGFIDPLEEIDEVTGEVQGLDRVTFVFTEAVFDLGSTNGGTQEGVLTTAGFAVEVTGGIAPGVQSISTADNMTVEVILDDMIPLQQWTTIIANVEDECGNEIVRDGDVDRIDIGFLPGDVDQNGETEIAADVVPWMQYFRNTLVPPVGVRADYGDQDRDGSDPEIADWVRFRQIQEGTSNITKRWIGEVLPTRP
jgi:hypothetical protein